MSDTRPDTPAVGEYTRLISLAVHELRTPLSVVAGYLRMLRDEPEEQHGDRRPRMIDEAEKSCRRLSALLEELSDLSKLDAGTATVAVESFDIFALIRDVAATLTDVTGDEARLEITGTASGGRMTGDKMRLRAALGCAMRAVRREHAAPSTVVVDAQRAIQDGHPFALITVATAPDLQLAKESPRGPLNDMRGGMGLGLPIARRVIAQLGGQIWSPSVSPEALAPRARGALGIALPLSD